MNIRMREHGLLMKLMNRPRGNFSCPDGRILTYCMYGPEDGLRRLPLARARNSWLAFAFKSPRAPRS